MNKELITQRFAKRLETYNDNARIQKQMAEKLISLLQGRVYENVLEIGCGTGILTNIAMQTFRFQNYYANDIVENCRKYIEKINPNIKFTAGDIETVQTDELKYDLIISNAAFQWIEDLENLIHNLVNKLNKDGILLFSTFGQENFREISFVQGKKLNYYSAKNIREIFHQYSPIVEEEIRIMAFRTPLDVLKHIQLTGVNSIEATFWTKKDFADFEKSYNNCCSNHPTLTYNPIYVKIEKSSCANDGDLC